MFLSVLLYLYVSLFISANAAIIDDSISFVCKFDTN